MLLTREQLQERLFALHRASLELVKDVSLETLLERIAAAACELAEARYSALGVLDEDGKLKQFITVGMTEDEIKRIPHPPKGMGLIGALMDAEYSIRVPEISEDSRSSGFPSGHAVMHSFLGVPIRTPDRQLGQLYLTDKVGADEFTQDDEMIIEMLSAYAAAAIQNARLYANLQERDVALTRRSQDMTLLNDIASALTASLEMDDILNKTLGLVMDYMQVEAGEIFLLEDDKQTLRLVLHQGQAADAFWIRNRFKMGEGIIGLVAKDGQPVVSLDLAGDVRYLREAVVEAGFRQMASLPMKAGENMIGVLSIVTRRKDPFDDRDIQMLAAVSNWAGLAIENARLHDNARRLAVLEERERIGMDLHDGIIQSVFAVGLSLEGVAQGMSDDEADDKQRIQRAIDDLNQAIRDIRSYILDLRPRQFDGRGLMDGLKRLVTEYRANTLSEATLVGPSGEIDGLPPSYAISLFHICQEALANAARHARAKKVSVGVWTTSDRVLIEIRDDGSGFETEKMNMNIGHGLANMQTRARSAGGEVDITSIPGEGTTVLAWVPREN
jgi:two-component system sensor histidine kinase DevS